MNYKRKIDTDKAVEVQISSFTGKGGTTEYQVMVSITDPCLSFVEQLPVAYTHLTLPTIA